MTVDAGVNVFKGGDRFQIGSQFGKTLLRRTGARKRGKLMLKQKERFRKQGRGIKRGVFRVPARFFREVDDRLGK